MSPLTLRSSAEKSEISGERYDCRSGAVLNEVCFKTAGLDLSGHDLPAIEILAEMGVKISREEALKIENNFLFDQKTGEPYLVVTGSYEDVVVAAATVSIRKPLSGEFDGTKILEIAKLAVFEGHQGKGLGRLFVESIEATARMHDCQKVVAATVNWRSAAFWWNVGYEPTRSSYGKMSPDGYYPGSKDFCKTIS